MIHELARFPPLVADDEDVVLPERSAPNEDCRDRTAPLILLSFNDGSDSLPVRIGFQLHQFGLESDRIQKFIDAVSGYRRHLDVKHVSRPLLHDHAVAEQLVPYCLRICGFLVAFVDCDDDRDIRRLGMIDRLHRLRHHGVVRCDDQNDDIGDLSAARAHRGERRMTRRIKECKQLSVGGLHLVCADVLRDPACFR